MEKPRLFPALDGSSPGDEPASEDITGVPLKPLNEGAEWPDSFATGSGIASVTKEGLGEEPLAAEDQRFEEDTRERQEKKNRRSARERIAQITRRYRQEQDRAELLKEELSKRDQRIEALERRLSSHPMVRPSTLSESPYAQAAASGEGVEAPAMDVAQIVSQEVRRAIEPIVRHQEESERRQMLEREQQQSYMEALKELPELADPNSAESVAFREIWEGTRLKNDPEGPYYVALMVKGAFAEERQTRPAREARKRAASVVTSGPAPTPTETALPRRSMARLVDAGLERMRRGDDTADTYIAVRKAMRRAGTK